MITAPDGRILAAVHADQLLVPASILKVLTALAALHHLGAEYRYPTDLFSNSEGDLLIKGYGDPLLVSEGVAAIAQQLASQVKEVRALVLDDTYFAFPIEIPGRNLSNEPYDAPNGALCVNFNTVFFKKENGRWVSAEPQTPLLPSVIPKIEASGLTSGRITLADDRAAGLRYCGELFGYFLSKAGITFKGPITVGKVDGEKDQLLARHLSAQELTAVIANLLAFSNNFIANQLLLTMGAHVQGPPATVDKGVHVLRRYYHESLSIETGQIVEASGLSRRNRVSARAMMRIMEKFAPYYQLMRHEGRQWYKTGTLKDVHTRVGYLEAASGDYYRFVVMLNTPGKTANRVMKIVEKELK
jgi:D-alanyl-D-alanine carboxypeptidase/D-alanyl-D-alanine-endopeptidase (penicillin-binding protein 4)